ncbi:MAG: ATP-binding protein [Planctomycetes bacterium]|nr:ATP-binding protein [Planctomycetota bacterium]
MVLNLLANAVAFTPRGGRVEASLRSAEGSPFVLEVRDTGPGIAPEALPRIFEPFFTTRGSEGTGLGLAVSHGIVRAHGGSIEAANDPRGGALFTVRIPAGGAP